METTSPHHNSLEQITNISITMAPSGKKTVSLQPEGAIFMCIILPARDGCRYGNKWWWRMVVISSRDAGEAFRLPILLGWVDASPVFCGASLRRSYMHTSIQHHRIPFINARHSDLWINLSTIYFNTNTFILPLLFVGTSVKWRVEEECRVNELTTETSYEVW